MALIVLNVFPHPTQFAESFAFAKCLRKMGHHVHYASDQADYKDVVRANGFPFYLIKHEKKFRHPLDPVFNIVRLFARINFIDQYVDLFRYLRSVRNAATNKSLFDKMFADLKPDLVLIDHDLPFNALQLTRYGVPCALLRTRPPREMADAVLPFTSLPSFSGKAKIWKVKMLWHSYFFLRSIRRMVHRLQGLGTEQYYLAREVRTRWKDKRMVIDPKGNFYFHDDAVPELVLYPADMEIGGSLASHQIYLGCPRWTGRQCSFDYVFRSKLIELKRGKTNPLVVYDLQPRTRQHVNACKSFVQKLVDSFRDLPYELIVAVGDDIEPQAFRSPGRNVHFYHSIPFGELLQHADLVITDADLARLGDCVVSGVPVLVYPLPQNWEQTGNSTRAVYHGLGLRGNLENETTKAIRKKITRILTSSEFKTNGKRLKEKILLREKDVSLQDVILRLLGSSVKVPTPEENPQEINIQ